MGLQPSSSPIWWLLQSLLSRKAFGVLSSAAELSWDGNSSGLRPRLARPPARGCGAALQLPQGSQGKDIGISSATSEDQKALG